MKLKLNINSKLLLYIITISLIIYATAIGYISINSKISAYNDATKIADKHLHEYASKIETKFNEQMAVVRTLSQAFATYKLLPEDEWKELFSNMYENIFNNNPDFYAIWDSWELSFIDSAWNKPHGRYIKTYWRENNEIKNISYLKSLDGDPETYAVTKAAGIESIWEPYFDVFDEGKTIQIFMTSLISPLLENGRFMGLVGIDIDIKMFHNLVNEIKPFKNTTAYLLSYEGVFAGHPNEKLIGQNFIDIYPDIAKKYEIVDNIKNGEYLSFKEKDKKNGEFYYHTFAPIIVGQTVTPWSLCIKVPVKIIMQEANKNFIISIIIGLIGLLILTIIIWIIARSISKPLIKTTKLLKYLSKGKIENTEKLIITTKDEIGEMSKSLNTLIDGLNNTANFAKQIGQGNLDAEFQLLGEEDVLGNSLLEMRKNLKHAEEEEEKRKTEAEKQNWITQGVAKFGDILRQNNNNLDLLSFNIISNLINYLNANQGAIYMLNDKDKNDIYFEVKSAIAYGRKKIIDSKIIIGEGLVGRCAFEKMTIFITDVPDNYSKITSGLGEANPRCVLFVPLLFNDEVFGVIELLSFTKFEDYQISFVEKVNENIASTISSVKINEKTAELLEQSQKQSEELHSQEEEMRQNIEEMHATQEEFTNREIVLKGMVNAINSVSLIAEYDLDGVLIKINDKFCKLLGLPEEKLVGKNHGSLIETDKKSIKNHSELWNDLRNGIKKKIKENFTIGNKNLWLSQEFVPVLDDSGTPIKVICIAFDITDKTNVSNQLDE
ncbi:MAG: GAF domain-containing protein [Bacteroidales bacterium]|nr:GAF domain-containing protein [Bacteroidales bacterium]